MLGHDLGVGADPSPRIRALGLRADRPAGHRLECAHSAKRDGHPGVPQPFRGDDVRERLAAALTPLEPFDCVLASTGWFGDDVLWLAPADDAPFRALIGSVERVFPALRPYDGAHAETVPHLTIGDGRPHTELREAERAIQTRLPLHGRVELLTLLVEQSDATWRTSEAFMLGRRR
ncbi:2'-5' RNA ligase family protein [Microbacterium karelineae]|uniref:2'-5' RNA ligase family protein n=1 Tax=Microbacterium karelineae TaxID=2654283 RepID=UPI0012E9E01B|nr:2'-5' RNA ligase family protein [Microbacterium karelineae]